MEKCKNAIVSGVLSGCLTSVIFQPLEVIKTKLQQTSNINRTAYTVLRRSIETDGVLVFWNGLRPALYRSVPVVSVYFVAIESLRNMAVFQPGNMFTSFLTGGLARGLSDISVYPLSLIKTRYESDFYKYPSIMAAFKSVVKENGFIGLYKGLNVTLVRDINYSGLYYMFYVQLKIRINANHPSSLQIASCALLSGLLACLLTQPTDVIRTRMQLHTHECRTSLMTAKIIFKDCGFRGFFVGFLPRASRRILISILSWTIFEKLSVKTV